MDEADKTIFLIIKSKKMSKQIKLYTILALFLVIGKVSIAQTVEVPTTSGTFPGGVGPTTAAVGPISLMRDNSNNNNFTPASGANVISATMSLANQQYTGLTYSNISTGLVFGAVPTPASPGAVQKVDPGNTFDNLGSFSVSPGGPVDNMFTATSGFPPGTGIVSGAVFNPGVEANGAVFVFTAAQPQFDAVGGPTVNNTSTRYYYGDLVINFNRYIANPVLHIAGLGGSYRYFPTTGTDINNPAQWLSTYFTTELEIVGANGFKLSGTTNLSVVGSSITNTSLAPSGASVSTVGGLFDEIGAASGSLRLGINTNTIRLKIYLRGSNSSQFAWSAIGAPGAGQQVSGGTRNPFTGDIWSVSVSAELSQLITLPSTGVNLTAALNGNDVLLKWKTETEVNSKNFEIERSTDGINFTSIGAKSAAGNSVSQINYSEVDPNMNASVYYYRLKLVDIDGKFTYSNIAQVRKSGSIKSVKMFPNPAASQINLEFSNAKGSYMVSLYNQAGQEVISQKSNITYGVQYVTINRNSLASGNYFVKVKSSDNTEVLFAEKIVLQ